MVDFSSTMCFTVFVVISCRPLTRSRKFLIFFLRITRTLQVSSDSVRTRRCLFLSRRYGTYFPLYEWIYHNIVFVSQWKIKSCKKKGTASKADKLCARKSVWSRSSYCVHERSRITREVCWQIRNVIRMSSTCSI